MRAHSSGFTLIELMIVVAIIAVIAGIAIPAYSNYIKESQFAAAKANVEPLRLMLEDYWLDNGDYGAGGANKTALDTNYSWQPVGDDGAFGYAVTVNNGSYTITVTHTGSSRSVQCQKTTGCTYSE